MSTFLKFLYILASPKETVEICLNLTDTSGFYSWTNLWLWKVFFHITLIWHQILSVLELTAKNILLVKSVALNGGLP